MFLKHIIKLVTTNHTNHKTKLTQKNPENIKQVVIVNRFISKSIYSWDKKLVLETIPYLQLELWNITDQQIEKKQST